MERRRSKPVKSCAAVAVLAAGLDSARRSVRNWARAWRSRRLPGLVFGFYFGGCDDAGKYAADYHSRRGAVDA